jgi:hypothetical protein
VSGVASLTVFPGAEYEPLPGSWLRIRAFARHPFGQFLATLSIPCKDRSLNLGTLTLSGVNKYNDSVVVVEYRYINSTTGYLQSVLFAYNDKVS